MFELTLLISAVATAMVYVLSAYGLVVTYRVAGVFNLALGYQAALAAFLYWQFVVDWGWSRYIGAILVVFIAGPLMGIVIQQVLFRKRREVLSSIIITLGLGVLINGVIQVLWGATSELRTVPSIFGDKFWRVGSTSLTVNELGVIASAAIIGVLVWFSSTAAGLGCTCVRWSTIRSSRAQPQSRTRESARSHGSWPRCSRRSRASSSRRSSTSMSCCWRASS